MTDNISQENLPAIIKEVSAPESVADLERLKDYIKVAHLAEESVMAGYLAMFFVHRDRLYKRTHKSFEAFVLEEFGMARGTAMRWVDSARILLDQFGEKTPLSEMTRTPEVRKAISGRKSIGPGKHVSPRDISTESAQGTTASAEVVARSVEEAKQALLGSRDDTQIQNAPSNASVAGNGDFGERDGSAAEQHPVVGLMEDLEQSLERAKPVDGNEAWHQRLDGIIAAFPAPVCGRTMTPKRYGAFVSWAKEVMRCYTEAHPITPTTKNDNGCKHTKTRFNGTFRMCETCGDVVR